MRVYTVHALYGVAYVKPGQVCDSVDAVRRRFKLSQRFTCLAYVMFVLLSTVCRPIERHYEKHSTLYVHVDYVRVPITSGSGDI